MTFPKRFEVVAALLWLAGLPAMGQLPPREVRPNEGLPPALQAVGIEQRLDAQVPLDAVFSDEHGRTLRFGDLFGERPVILVLAYYTCPMLCSQVLNGTAKTLSILELAMGLDYEVVTVSFDPRDTTEAALSSKAGYVLRAGKAGSPDGWHFLTGEESQIRKLTESVGFAYTFDPDRKQYAHASAILVLTPEGRVSRYYFGIEYSARDLRLGLVEASNGRIGNPVDQLLLYCYQYDPATGRYGAVVMNMLRVAAVLTLIVLIAMILLLRPAWTRHRRADVQGAKP